MSDPTLNALAARVAGWAAAQVFGSEAQAHLLKAAKLIMDADEALEREAKPNNPSRSEAA